MEKKKVAYLFSKAKVVSKRSYIYFGSDRKKFYLFTGFVQSNPDKFTMVNNEMFKTDVMNTFTLSSNNGKGFTVILSQVLFQSSSKADQTLVQTKVKIN